MKRSHKGLIDVTKPAGKVFETAMLDAERAIAGTMSSGIEIAVRIFELVLLATGDGRCSSHALCEGAGDEVPSRRARGPLSRAG
jgi:hypothetical protein